MQPRVHRLSRGAVEWSSATATLRTTRSAAAGAVLWIERTVLPTAPALQRRTKQPFLGVAESWTPCHSLQHLLAQHHRAPTDALAALLEALHRTEASGPHQPRVLNAMEVLMATLLRHNQTGVRRAMALEGRTRTLPGVACAAFPVAPAALDNIVAVMQGTTPPAELDTQRHAVLQLPALFVCSQGLRPACFGSSAETVVATTFLYKGSLHEAVVAKRALPPGTVLRRALEQGTDGPRGGATCGGCGGCAQHFTRGDGDPPAFVAQCVWESMALARVEAQFPPVAATFAARSAQWPSLALHDGHLPTAVAAARAQRRSILAHCSKHRRWRPLPTTPQLAMLLSQLPQPCLRVWCQGGVAATPSGEVTPPTPRGALAALHNANELLAEEWKLQQAMEKAKAEAGAKAKAEAKAEAEAEAKHGTTAGATTPGNASSSM